MKTDDLGISRRRLLSLGSGAIGFLALAGGASRVLAGSVTYTDVNVVEGGSVNLQVEWTEQYNGQTLSDEEVPQIQLFDVKPGDSGRLAVKLTTIADEDDEQTVPVSVQSRIRELPNSRAENGRNEPELVAGDTTDSTGELQDELLFDIWDDNGVMNEALIGHCDGSGDALISGGSFADVASDYADGGWTTVTSPTGNPDCLEPDESICLLYEWSIPEDVGNIIQTDSVSFAIEYRVVQC